MEVARLRDMRIIRTIGMIRSLGKRVCKLVLVASDVLTEGVPSVC
jgi:hypothetical protein